MSAPLLPQESKQQNHPTLVVAGYGVRIAVERGQLLVQDGIGADRVERRIPRAQAAVRRLVVLGHAGTVTLDALRWLHDVGISFVHIDNDAALLTVGATKAVNDVHVRRGQALANANGVGLSVAKDLIAKKVAGQERVASMLGAFDAVRWLKQAATLVRGVGHVDDLRFVESKAAAAYWDGWQGVPTHFTPRDTKRVPAHWLTFESRRSILSRSPRKADCPANALLNYLYSILEAEARIALLKVGADTSMGVLHVDSTRRESFACDVMEAVRPDVDEYVLGLLRSHTFTRADFFETVDGNCRLMPSLARPLSATAPRWVKRLAPIVESAAAAFAQGSTAPIANQLSKASTLPVRFRTPLTQRNRSDSRPRAPRSTRDVGLDARCRGCGVSLGSLKRSHCDKCIDEQRTEAAAKGRATLSERRATGHDGRSTAAVRAERAASATRQMHQIAAWEAEHGGATDAKRYTREIAPLLRAVPIRVLTDATGLSVVYCRQLRLGKRTPHPRHWEALRSVALNHGQAIPAEWDTAFYLREIAPKVVRFTPEQVAAACGLSIAYCKRVRRGKQLPRREHWAKLYQLVS